MARKGCTAVTFELNNIQDKTMIDFLNAQPRKGQTLKLGMNVLMLLFGNEDLSNSYMDIEKYGLINILEKRLQTLKQESSEYVGKKHNWLI